MYEDAWSACRCLPCASSYHCKLCGADGVWVVSVLPRMAVVCVCVCSVRKRPLLYLVSGYRSAPFPTSVLRWDFRAWEANLPTSCSNLVIPGVSEVEQCSPRGVRIQYDSQPTCLYLPVPKCPVPTTWSPLFPVLTLKWSHCCPSQRGTDEPRADTFWSTDSQPVCCIVTHIQHTSTCPPPPHPPLLLTLPLGCWFNCY